MAGAVRSTAGAAAPETATPDVRVRTPSRGTVATIGEFGVFDELSDIAHGYYIDGFSERSVEACRHWLRLSQEAGDVITSRYLRYTLAVALQELGRHGEAVAACEALLGDLGDDLEPVWRAKALSVIAEASTRLGEHARALAALAEADWLLRAIPVGLYGHLSASMAVALGLRSVNLLEQSDAALSGINGGGSPGIGVLVAQELALLSAYWGTSLLLVNRSDEAGRHFAVAASRSRRMRRLAGAVQDVQMVARADVIEAYATVRLGQTALGAARAREAAAVFSARPELVESHLLHMVLAADHTALGRFDQARGHLRTFIADAERSGREMWIATGTAALAGVFEAERGPNEGMALWRAVASTALARVWSERGARFAALRDRNHLRELVVETDRIGQAVLQDPLTGLGNRRVLTDALERGAERRSAVFVDVDEFKAVNDTFSHGIGDEVLRTLADLLRRESRKSDLLLRYGGDEFLILPDGGRDAAMELAERVRWAVAQHPWDLIAPGLIVTVSIGVGHAGDSMVSPLAAADAALLTAKRAGRNRIWTA